MSLPPSSQNKIDTIYKSINTRVEDLEDRLNNLETSEPVVVTGLPVADYDSGWFAVTTSTLYTKAHGLASTPRLVMLTHSLVLSPGSTDDIYSVFIVTHSAAQRSVLFFNGTNIFARTGDSAVTGTIIAVGYSSAAGYYRMLAWE